MRSIFACLLVGGCGFQPAAGPGDASELPPIDGAVMTMTDAPDGAMPDGRKLTCMERWRDHSVALGNPARIDGLSTGGEERDPWISADNKRLYFNRNPGTQGLTDIYLATRTATDGAWVGPELQANLSTNREESRAAFTEDELAVVLASDRDGESFRILSNVRNSAADPFGTPTATGFDSINNMGGPGADRYDPFLTNEGKTLFYAPDPMGPERQHIWFATRTALNQPFGNPSKLAVVNGDNNMVTDSDPALTLDEKVILFSSTRGDAGGTGNLWYATRDALTANFGPPMVIPTVNGNADDGDPMLSRDGCDLYFASTRGGSFDLYVSHVTN